MMTISDLTTAFWMMGGGMLALWCVLKKRTLGDVLLWLAYQFKWLESLAITFSQRLISDVRAAWPHIRLVARADANEALLLRVKREKIMRRVMEG